MKKRSCFVFLATLLLFLMSCEKNQENTDYLQSKETSEVRESVDITYYKLTEEPFVPSSVAVEVEIELWRPYKGSIPKVDLQDLETLATRAKNGDIFFLGTYYEELIIPDDKYEFAYTSGWRVDLDCLSIVGKTETNDMVLAQDLSSPTLLCTIDASSNVTLYFRKDFASGGLGAIDISDFDVLNEGEIVEGRSFVEWVWKNHVQEPADLYGTILLDGDFIDYRITLRHKAETAIQYELNFGICGGKLYLENPYVRFDHVVPMKDLLIDIIEVDEKTGGGSLS